MKYGCPKFPPRREDVQFINGRASGRGNSLTLTPGGYAAEKQIPISNSGNHDGVLMEMAKQTLGSISDRLYI